MTAQILAISIGFVAAGLLAWHDYRQTRTADGLLGALLTFGLFASVGFAVAAQA
jgi:hypothetical protein